MPDPAPRRLRVVVGDERGRPLTAGGLARWLRRVAPARAHGTVSVAIVSDAQVRALNRTYRHKDVATDVLSFPVENSPPQRMRRNTLSTPKRFFSASSASSAVESSSGSMMESFLGEIVIARGVARAQARAAGHDETTELRILALHGLLHLMGYDHERDRGAMRRVERRLRRQGGLREGLIERGSA
jgi:probable rRNA maturation factor